MTFVLEKINQKDEEKILSDASSNERILGFLKMRGGHFQNNPGMNWVIDRELDSYMFWAPKPAMSKEYHYCFYYKHMMYVICFESLVNPKIFFDEKSPPPNPIDLEMKNSIRLALFTHGAFGVLGDRPLAAFFEGEK